MICKQTYCALVLMTTLAQHYPSEGLAVKEIARLHHLPLTAFRGVAARLHKAGLVIGHGTKISLRHSPEKITIWQVVESVTHEEVLVGEELEQTKGIGTTHSSTVIMLNKERALQRHIMKTRLNRYKLSTWSEKASKIVYI